MSSDPDGSEDGPGWSDPVGSRDKAMEINNHFASMPHKVSEAPTTSPLMYMRGAPPLITDPDLQTQLLNMQKQYQVQAALLNQSFEQRHLILAREQERKMQEYIKPDVDDGKSPASVVRRTAEEFFATNPPDEPPPKPIDKIGRFQQTMMLQKQQQDMLEHQQKMQEQKRKQEMMQKQLIMNKDPGQETAVASPEVKEMLHKFLILKQGDHMKHSPPHLRLRVTQHASLEQHSPPTSGLSPPLQPHHQLLGPYNEEYPLRKAVSMPNVKMPSLMALRNVVKRNSPMTQRRGLGGHKKKLLFSSTSEPNLKVRLALKQKMKERRSSPLLLRKDRFNLAVKRNTTPLAIDTTVCDSNPDSGPNSPPCSSQGSSASEAPQREELSGVPLDMMSRQPVNQSMPDITLGSKMESPGSSALAGSSEAELRARLAAQYGMQSHMSTGSQPFYPFPVMSDSGELIAPTSPAYVEAQMKALELARSTGQLHLSPPLQGLPYTNPQEVAAAQPRMDRPSLIRTQSAPLPLHLPGHLLYQQQMMLSKQPEEMLKVNQRQLILQKLQVTVKKHKESQRVTKSHMENVDEETEARIAQEMKEIREKEEDIIVVDDKDDDPQRHLPHNPTNHHQAFPSQFRPRPIPSGSTLGGAAAAGTTAIPRILQRTKSNPLVTYPMTYPSRHSPPVEDAAGTAPSTGLAYDSLMLKHHCLCGDDSIHPENPGRLRSIQARLQEAGLFNRCQRLKPRQAELEELQMCHSEAYTLIYGSTFPKTDLKLDPQTETLLSRFCNLPCGGRGVDDDTVWNDTHTSQVSRTATGCVIDLVVKVATGELKNGFAIVRPPGHHAEPTQAMGFCYFNSIAVATKVLLNRLHMKKILIVDWDVHHGNSTQQIFYADPRVLYMSLHRHDNGNFFPGTGAPEECGIDRGRGYNVNVAWSGCLQPPMGDAEYLTAFRTIVMPIARDFQPEVVLVSAGFDGAAGHPAPLGGYNLSPTCFGYMTKQLQTLANGRLALVLEGGYELQGLCDCTEMCLRALLGEEIPLFKNEEICRSPCQVAIETLETTIKYQESFWPVVRPKGRTLRCSALEAQQRDRDEADTVMAFASLSVLPEKTAHSSMEGNGHASEQPMEQA